MVPDHNGNQHCEQCKPGTYQDVKGQPTCLSCPADTYNEQFGSTAQPECVKCTDVALSTTTNGSTGVSNATRCVCQQNFYHNVRPSGREDYCLPCPFGGLCPKVKTLMSTVVSREGFWRSGIASSTFYACPTPETCVGGAIRRTADDQCVQGNAGILCATCAKHYVRSGGACTWCKDGVGTVGMLWMLIVAAILYVAILSYVLSRIKEVVQPPNTTASASRIGTSMMVLSAIAKMRRKSRASADIQGAVEDEAKGQASESAGDNAGEFEVDAFSKFAGRLRIFSGSCKSMPP